MTVVYRAGDRSFRASEILWAKRDLVEAIVEQALIGQTEGFIDMITDTERPADITRDSVNNTLRGVPDSARDFLNDVLSDLQQEVERRLKSARYGASVTGIKYDLAGDVTDIEVDVTVSFEE